MDDPWRTKPPEELEAESSETEIDDPDDFDADLRPKTSFPIKVGSVWITIDGVTNVRAAAFKLTRVASQEPLKSYLEDAGFSIVDTPNGETPAGFSIKGRDASLCCLDIPSIEQGILRLNRTLRRASTRSDLKLQLDEAGIHPVVT